MRTPRALDMAEAAVRRARDFLGELGPVSVDGGVLRAGQTALDEDTDIVDEVMETTGFGCTIFHHNRRVATTAMAAGSGARAVGTTANAEITQLVYRTGATFRGITRTIGKDWVIVYVPLRNATRRIVGMLAAYRELVDFLGDLTMLDGASEAVFMHQADGALADVNQAACDMLGRSRAELLELTVLDFTRGPDPAAIVAGWRNIGSEPVRLEAFWERADGHLFPIEVSVARTPPSSPAPFLCIARDFTEAHTARERLRVVNAELTTANAALRAAEQQALAASETKSAFLANMSHELRTPLNAILGYSEIVIEEADELGAPGLVPDVRRIHRAGAHLLALVDDILDLAKIEAGRMEVLIEPVDLPTLLVEARVALLPLVEKRGNRFEIVVEPGLGTVHTDRTKLRQCLYNLVGNAAKFTADGTVTIDARHTGERARIEVRDTGIGMTSAQLAHVFDEFAQAEAATTRTYGGTGLGLALVRKLAQLLGGSVVAHSEAGVGSTFVLELPVDEAAT